MESSSSKPVLSSAIHALTMEMKSLHREPVEGFDFKLVDDNNLFTWEVAIFGPPDTLYAGGYFKVSGVQFFNRLHAQQFCIWTPDRYGAVHKVRHAIFLPILAPLPLSHFVTHRGPPIKYVTSRNPPPPRITRLQYALLNFVRSALIRIESQLYCIVLYNHR